MKTTISHRGLRREVDWGEPARFIPMMIESMRRRISGVPGIYGFLRGHSTNPEWVYVGETGDLHDRLSRHLRSESLCVRQHAYWFVILPTEVGANRTLLESVLIEQLNPLCQRE